MAALHPLVPTIAFCRLLWSWGRTAQPGSPWTSSDALHKREMQALEVCPSFILCIHKTVMGTKCIDEEDSNNNDRNLYFEGEDDRRWVWRSSSASCHSLALSSRGLDQEVGFHQKDGTYQLIHQPGDFHEKNLPINTPTSVTCLAWSGPRAAMATGLLPYQQCPPHPPLLPGDHLNPLD